MRTNNIPAPPRITFVDVYRGFVMFLMMGEVLSFEKVSKALPDSGFWQFLSFHQSHVEWVGCSLHDMIQPSFSFLVGVALRYSIAARESKGESFNTMLFHAIRRALILILLGIFLRSMWSKQTNFTFEDTLTQIGLGYVFLFLLGFRSFKVIIISLIAILVGYFAAFALTPSVFSTNSEAIGVPQNWSQNLTGFMSHWNKNTNFAANFDVWFMNLFPRESTYLYNEGGYLTLSFIPTLGTMILGLIAGRELKSDSEPKAKVFTFFKWGMGLLLGGLALHFLGVCPIVKRIWTPSWVLLSGGNCFLFLALFYDLVDVLQTKKWYYFLLVIGANSIAAYVIAHTVDGFISKSLYIHLGKNYADFLGTAYSPFVHGFWVLLFEWLILYWMYKRKIFIKI
jgi:predicted acyltransferase